MTSRQKTPLVTDERPNGGLSEPSTYYPFLDTLSPSRGPARCMYPAEFLNLLRRFRSGHLDGIGIAVSRAVNYDRRQMDIKDEHGTLWVSASGTLAEIKGQDGKFSVPCNCLPYLSVKPPQSAWDPVRNVWTKPQMRGWRSALSELLAAKLLRRDPELLWLIGELPRW